ncbi:MAG: hypothetical protein ACPGVB_10095 [Chitinophagales bacterium]
MEDNLHNDNLEDFFRKSLGDYEDNPDDTAWGNIAPFIAVPTGASEITTLQSKVQQLSNQNLLLKTLLAAMSVTIVCLLIFQPFNSNNHQQKITLLGQQLHHQNETIATLTNKIDSLYVVSDQNIATNTSIVSHSTNSTETTFISSNLQSKNIEQAGAKFNTIIHRTTKTGKQAKNPSEPFNNKKIQQPNNLTTKKSLHLSASVFNNPRFQDSNNSTIQQSNQITNPHSPILSSQPYLLVEENDRVFQVLKRKEINQLEKEKKKRFKIELPSLNLKSIVEQLTVSTYLQLGESENHFRYEDSFIGEELVKINGKFEEDAQMQQYGLLVGYAVNPKLQIESGIGKLKYSQDLNGVNIKGIYTTPNINGALTFNDQFYSSYSDNQIQFTINDIAQQFPSANIGDTLRVPITLQQELSYLSVPLAVKYNIGEKRLSFYIKGGVAANFLVENELEISSPHPSFGKPDFTSSNGLESIYFTFQLEAGLQYQISKRIGLQIAPYFMGSLSQLTESLPVIAYPSTRGVQVGAKYEF